MNSFIPWVGGKGKLLWIINKLMPDRYTRFIDVFGGSGTVTMCRPIQRGCMEVYNDFNGNLTNLFCCVKNRPMALLAELGFLPLNTRDDFNILYKFFSRGEFTDDYLQEEMDLTEVYLKPPDAEAIRALITFAIISILLSSVMRLQRITGRQAEISGLMPGASTMLRLPRCM